eukprot:1160634-Pelagomonas_calceolata.AAC.11
MPKGIGRGKVMSPNDPLLTAIACKQLGSLCKRPCEDEEVIDFWMMVIKKQFPAILPSARQCSHLSLLLLPLPMASAEKQAAGIEDYVVTFKSPLLRGFSQQCFQRYPVFNACLGSSSVGMIGT